MSYISASDITNQTLKASAYSTILSAKLTDADNAIIDLAERLGVRDSTNIETSPLHRKIKEFAIAWVCEELSLDLMGYNNVSITDYEKYRLMYETYKKRREKYEGQITKEMITGSVDEIRDRATSRTGIITRG